MQLAFHFGQSPAGITNGSTIGVPNPIIDGRAAEPWADVTGGGRACGSLTLWQCGDELWGAGFADVSAQGFDAAAQALYTELFNASRRLTLHRIWNLIPRINAHDAALENYQAFCEGRHRAFQAHFGSAGEQRMPAASAVGTLGDTLCVVFVAGTDAVSYVENPEQVPAYRYPSRYGPRSPSFARGSLVQRHGGQRLYVSGTASIRRSESLHPGDVAAQFELAMANVDLVARNAGLLHGLDAESPGQRSFRIYLRHADDWPVVRPLFEKRLQRSGDGYSVLQADICRRELLVEIEACVDNMGTETTRRGN
ncbi:MAG: hypothetical protein U5Q16_03885 [Gammaproteobacteria bacterium]|nr:hypothetical protein [Gammaproteobacteria bacterium]